MLRSLFARLTPHRERGQQLFAAAVAEARRPHWYVEGEVEDDIDGRFAILATVLALITVRLEQGDVEARAHSAALVERFVEAMDAEHRQLGISDPALGKTVRKLVSSLANRVDLWRTATADGGDFGEAARASIFRGAPPSDEALSHARDALMTLWTRLAASSDERLMEGRIG